MAGGRGMTDTDVRTYLMVGLLALAIAVIYWVWTADGGNE